MPTQTQTRGAFRARGRRRATAGSLLISNARNFPDRQALAKIERDFRARVLPAARANIPVRTGRLRASLDVSVTPSGIAFTSDVFYAKAARFRTQPRTTRGAVSQAARGKITPILIDALRDQLRRERR